MLSNQKAFTLIELLVVVLIIGILAAVAVPQYQVTVMKSRFMELVTLGETIHRMEEVYHLGNGYYTDDFSALDVEVPEGITLGLWNPENGNPALYIDSSKLPNMRYLMYLDQINGTSPDGYRTPVGCRECRTTKVDGVELERKVCSIIAGQTAYTPNDVYYVAHISECMPIPVS